MQAIHIRNPNNAMLAVSKFVTNLDFPVWISHADSLTGFCLKILVQNTLPNQS